MLEREGARRRASRGAALVPAGCAIGLLQLPSAAASPRLDLAVSGLWMESVAYSAIPYSGTGGTGLSLDVYPASALAVELAAAFPSDISLATQLGSVRLQAYTLTAQYHFLRRWRVSPYVGGGAFRSTQSLDTRYSIIGLDSSSTSWAVQAGLDARIASHWFARFDLRYFGDIGSATFDITSPKIPRKIPLNITPVIIGLGIGYRIE